MHSEDQAAILQESDALVEYNLAAGSLSTLTTGMAAWAGVVTILIVVLIAILFKRIRKSTTWDAPPPSHISDAESAVSDSSGKESYDTCSVVDVDITGLSNNGQINEAYDSCSNLDMSKSHHTGMQVH